jgi:GH24 family phage-related lysozyme (muramidase)
MVLTKRLGIFAALALSAGAVAAAPALPDGPPPDSASVSPSGGQARGDSTVVVSNAGIGGVVVDWSASCPLADGQMPISHYWYVSVQINHADGDSEVYQSEAVTSDASASGQFRLVVKMKPKLDRETFDAHVNLNCNGAMKEIKQQQFALCRGASGASDDAKKFIKGIEKGECHKVERKNGKGRKTVCDAVALTEYNDSKGHCTIGWGHKLHDGKCECPDPDKPCTNKKENAKPPGGDHTFHQGITKADAQSLLDDDVAEAETLFKSLPDQPVNQCQFDGLADFFFNEGRSALYRNAKNKDYAPSRIKSDLIAGAYAKIPEDILRYDKKSKPLHERRQMDADTFGKADCGGC